MKLAKLSIAAKLYVIFALLATMTAALAAVAIFSSNRHVALTNEFESAFVGAENVERINSLIYAVVMESRGIYMSPDIATAKKFAEGLTRFNDQIGGVMEGWQRSVRPEDADVFAQFAARVKQFQEFRRELVRRGTEISPASGSEWGNNDANRTVRTALTNDLDVLGRLYASRSREIYSRIESGMETSALEMIVLGAAALMLAMFGALVIQRSIARPLAAVTRVTEAVAGGDATLAVPFRDRPDEIGALARSIAVFQDAMRRNVELNKTVLAEAEAKVQRQEQISAETARFGTNIEASLSGSTGYSNRCCPRRCYWPTRRTSPRPRPAAPQRPRAKLPPTCATSPPQPRSLPSRSPRSIVKSCNRMPSPPKRWARPRTPAIRSRSLARWATASAT